jgi:hypothetical protein
MLPTWFLIWLAFCAGWTANTAIRILKGHEVYIAGQKASRAVTGGAIAIIVVAIGIMVAIQLDFIPDHAP